MAADLNSFGAWKRALEDGGMDEYGMKRGKPLSDVGFLVLPLHTFHLCHLLAQHKNCHLHHANNIFLFNVHDLNASSMVYWNFACSS
jgi:hypothetical protein